MYQLVEATMLTPVASPAAVRAPGIQPPTSMKLYPPHPGTTATQPDRNKQVRQIEVVPADIRLLVNEVAVPERDVGRAPAPGSPAGRPVRGAPRKGHWSRS